MAKQPDHTLSLCFTSEMKVALNILTGKARTDKNFPIALRAERIGLIVLGGLDDELILSMLQRKKMTEEELTFLQNFKCDGLTKVQMPSRVKTDEELQKREISKK